MLANPYVPAIVVPFVLFALYRRFRRHFGRQPVQRGRMIARAVVLALVGLVFAAVSARDASLLTGALGGALVGAALAFVALRLTTFERTAAGTTYTPNPYIGALLSALLIGRLVYRFMFLAPSLQFAHPSPGGDPFAGVERSPLTSALVLMLVAYYLVYTFGVLARARALDATPQTEAPRA